MWRRRSVFFFSSTNFSVLCWTIASRFLAYFSSLSSMLSTMFMFSLIANQFVAFRSYFHFASNLIKMYIFVIVSRSFLISSNVGRLTGFSSQHLRTKPKRAGSISGSRSSESNDGRNVIWSLFKSFSTISVKVWNNWYAYWCQALNFNFTFVSNAIWVIGPYIRQCLISKNGKAVYVTLLASLAQQISS